MIGVFDSGVGGLSVVEHIKKKSPNTGVIYYGDLAHVPYGDRAKSEIKKFFEEGKGFLRDRGVDKIIVACNTVVAVTGEGIEMVEVGMRAANKNGKNIGVIGTTRTIESGIYDYRYSLVCPELVPMIESGVSDEKKLANVVNFVKKNEIDTLILGCTHYPLILKLFERLLPGVNLVDPGMELVNSLHFEIDFREDEYWFT